MPLTIISTLRQGKIPELLKSSIVSPIPKCMPPKTIEDDLRPISLTPQIAKISADSQYIHISLRSKAVLKHKH